MKTIPIIAAAIAVAALSAPGQSATAQSATAQSTPAKSAPAKSASGQAPAANRDLRCLMLSNLFAKTVSAEQAKAAAGQARLFYLGRVSSKFTPAQLVSAMNAEAKTIDADKAGPDMNKCLASVQAAAASVEAAGRKAAGAEGPPAAAKP